MEDRSLLFRSDGAGNGGGTGLPQFPRPQHLRQVISVSCSMSAREFFGLIRQYQVDVILDIRLTRTFRGQGFSSREDDFRYLAEKHGVLYGTVWSLMPTKEMRERFAETFKYVKRGQSRGPDAWTIYLQQYEELLKERRPFRIEPLQSIIYGNHEVVAVVCSCPHHYDCHRSFASGMMAQLLPDVELQVVYPQGRAPNRASPRRYRLHDFPWAGLKADAPKGRAER